MRDDVIVKIVKKRKKLNVKAFIMRQPARKPTLAEELKPLCRFGVKGDLLLLEGRAENFDAVDRIIRRRIAALKGYKKELVFMEGDFIWAFRVLK